MNIDKINHLFHSGHGAKWREMERNGEKWREKWED